MINPVHSSNDIMKKSTKISQDLDQAVSYFLKATASSFGAPREGSSSSRSRMLDGGIQLFFHLGGAYDQDRGCEVNGKRFALLCIRR